MIRIEQHPLSAAFPEMPESDYQALKDSIENIGVQNPITLFEGMVIDGWHRYRAATELGVTCPSVELGEVDPQEFVLAQNKARRHITQSQLALAASAVYAWMPEGRPIAEKQYSAPGAELKSARQIADAAGVSTRTIEQAKKVQTNAAPEVVDAVKRGEIGLKKAEAISKLPKEEQAEAVKKPMPKPIPEPGHYGPSTEEIEADAKARQEELESMQRVFEANDKVVAAMEEAKRYREENRILKERITGLMNEKNAAIRQAKMLQAKLSKYEKAAA